MDLLVVGGTRFVGRHIVQAALSDGHHLTLLHRGGSGEPYPEAEHLHADRDGDVSVLRSLLAGRRFDAAVDVCGYWPRQVRSLADALDGDGGQHLFVSSVSANAEPAGPGGDETTPLLDVDAEDPDALEMSDGTYGRLKVACEAAAAERHERLTIVRPSYVVGPYDPTDRFCWWLDRIGRGGEVLAPGPPDAPMQLMDAIDMGQWVVRLLSDGVTGSYHACSTDPGWTFGQMLDEIVSAIGPGGTELRWVDGGWLVEQGVDGSALPLWSEGTPELLMALDPAAARGTGLRARPFPETVLDTWRWMRGGGSFRSGPVELTDERAAELLRRASA